MPAKTQSDHHLRNAPSFTATNTMTLVLLRACARSIARCLAIAGGLRACHRSDPASVHQFLTAQAGKRNLPRHRYARARAAKHSLCAGLSACVRAQCMPPFQADVYPPHAARQSPVCARARRSARCVAMLAILHAHLSRARLRTLCSLPSGAYSCPCGLSACVRAQCMAQHHNSVAAVDPYPVSATPGRASGVPRVASQYWRGCVRTSPARAFELCARCPPVHTAVHAV